MMNWVDYTILGIIGLSAFVSLIRGFIKEAVSLVVWFGAFIISSNFHPQLSPFLTQIDNPTLRTGVAIGILFLATILAGAMVNYILSQLVKVSGLAGTDRVLGIVFGGLRGLLIVSALLFFIDTFTSLATHHHWQESQLIPEFNVIIQWFFDYLENNSSFLTPTNE